MWGPGNMTDTETDLTRVGFTKARSERGTEVENLQWKSTSGKDRWGGSKVGSKEKWTK